MEINKFVALDFEYLPTTQEIVQIGYAFVSNGEIIEERYQYIKPRCTPEYYNNQIYFLMLTGITYDMLHDAPTMEEVIPDLYKILNNNIIVAHNARSADLCVLTKELERCNSNNYYEIRWLSLLELDDSNIRAIDLGRKVLM